VFPGADYERVAPDRCERCGGSEFDRRGRVGLWDGGRGSGCTYEAIYQACGAVWHSLSDPFACRDRPQSLEWFCRSPDAEPGAAADTAAR
jgi:hypothetical protein